MTRSRAGALRRSIHGHYAVTGFRRRRSRQGPSVLAHAAPECALRGFESVAWYENGDAPLSFGGHGTTSAESRCRGSAHERALCAARAATDVVAIACARPPLADSFSPEGLVASDRTRGPGLRTSIRPAPTNPEPFAASARLPSRSLGRRRRGHADRRRPGGELGAVGELVARARRRRRPRRRVFVDRGPRARQRVAGLVVRGACDVQHGRMLGVGVRAAGRVRLGAAGRAHSPRPVSQTRFRRSFHCGARTRDRRAQHAITRQRGQGERQARGRRRRERGARGDAAEPARSGGAFDAKCEARVG